MSFWLRSHPTPCTHTQGAIFCPIVPSYLLSPRKYQWAHVSKFHLLGENVLQRPVCQPSSLQNLLVDCLGHIMPNKGHLTLSSSRPLISFLENTKQPQTLTLPSHAPVCHGTITCISLEILLKRLSRVCLPFWPQSLLTLLPHGTGPNSSQVRWKWRRKDWAEIMVQKHSLIQCLQTLLSIRITGGLSLRQSLM